MVAVGMSEAEQISALDEIILTKCSPKKDNTPPPPQPPSVLPADHTDAKQSPLDPMPPLATVVDVVNSNGTVVTADKVRADEDSSPPATVISLAPAQPYSAAGTTQLTFAAPAYDLATHNGQQYTVQVSSCPVCNQLLAQPAVSCLNVSRHYHFLP